MAAQQEQPPAAGAATQERVAEVVFEALPDLQEQELIDLLDFIFTQHSGSAFNPDNTPKKDGETGEQLAKRKGNRKVLEQLRTAQ